jgi:NitT/TauT family transport system ATP-binding protein
MLNVEGLHHSYGTFPVLDRISFSARQGEFVTFVGPSGCGKTVLLKILVGLQSPTGGHVRVEGEAAYAFQKSPLFPWLTLEENVRLCVSGSRRAREESEEQIRAYFRAAGLAGFERELPWRISGGMRQKVNVIRAFCSGRPIILMDEPFVSLDFPSRQELQQLTLELWAKEKKTIVFVTHDLDEALQLSSRVLVLSNRPARVLKEIPVEFPYPRDPIALRASPAYTRAYGEIAELLLRRNP